MATTLKVADQYWTPILLLVGLLVVLTPTSLHAQIVDCDAQVLVGGVPATQVAPGSTHDFTFTVTNGSAARIHWLKFTRPSSNFTLGSMTDPANGWTISSHVDSFTISGGSINAGASRNFTLTNVTAANVNAASANWTVEASDVPSGANPYACTGTLGTQIGTGLSVGGIAEEPDQAALAARNATASRDHRVVYSIVGASAVLAVVAAGSWIARSRRGPV